MVYFIASAIYILIVVWSLPNNKYDIAVIYGLLFLACVAMYCTEKIITAIKELKKLDRDKEEQ